MTNRKLLLLGAVFISMGLGLSKMSTPTLAQDQRARPPAASGAANEGTPISPRAMRNATTQLTALFNAYNRTLRDPNYKSYIASTRDVQNGRLRELLIANGAPPITLMDPANPIGSVDNIIACMPPNPYNGVQLWGDFCAMIAWQ